MRIDISILIQYNKLYDFNEVLTMELHSDIIQYINHHSNEAFSLLTTLAQIPAPSHHENQRAQFCAKWLTEQGAEGVYIDDALNVIYPIGCDGDNPIAVFMAHSDVVFPDTTPLPLYIADNRIYCPGVGDDTANVVALLMAAKYIAQHRIVPTDMGVLLVVNACEEGLGNLKGSRKVLEAYKGRVAEFITFDGTAGQIVNHAVGSRRYKVEVTTEGGHSYSKFGNTNAIAVLASMIDKLYAVKVPPLGKTTYNVGTIAGGTSVNTIAQHAQMLYEYRSDSREAMDIMEDHFQNILADYRSNEYSVSVTLMGDRPCSGKIDQAQEVNLMTRAADAIKQYYGYDPVFRSGSTDCNIPLSQGIPAVCVGCVEGEGAHTREEYVEIPSLLPGLKVAFSLILHHF